MPLCHQNQVWPPLAEQGHQEVTITLSTRLPMVSMSRASESLVGAWVKSCRVRGRLSMLMMARPKSSKACSIGSISREQVGWWYQHRPICFKKFFHFSSHIWANVVVLQPNVVSISSSLVWKAEIFQNVQLHEGVDVSIRGHQWRFSSFMNTDPYHHWAAITYRAGSWMQ